MEGNEKIIAKILNDANIKANDILENAKNICDKKIQDATEWADNYLKVQKEMLSKEATEIISRKNTNAEIDSKKRILLEKQTLISVVFDEVYKNLCNLSKKEYLNFVEKYLNKSAENEDTVVLSNDGVLSDADIKNLSIYKQKNLSISKTNGDFKGGVKLIGKVSDKDLSFKAITNACREEYVNLVVEKLFN